MSLPAKSTIPVEAFKVEIPQQAIDELNTLIKLGKLPPETYEGQHRQFGVTRKWMAEAKEQWLNGYKWRKSEARMNEFPQYVATVKGRDGRDYKIHFIGIFSGKENAVPLCMLHGWPGSFIEYLELIPELKKSTNPVFDLIVPSLPGYTFSSRPPVDHDFDLDDMAFLINGLMEGLGYTDAKGGYIAQGGDIGSMVSRLLMTGFDACRGAHLNMFFVSTVPEGCSTENIKPIEKEGLERAKDFMEKGSGYRNEHATKPSTIAHANASSPLALLAWLGEKFLDWTDKDPSIDLILEHVTLWWLTETFPTSIYPYRAPKDRSILKKPTGYSWFPKEIAPAPKSWMDKLANFIYFKEHSSGGHFAAFEEPKALAEDIAAYVNKLHSAKL